MYMMYMMYVNFPITFRKAALTIVAALALSCLSVSARSQVLAPDPDLLDGEGCQLWTDFFRGFDADMASITDGTLVLTEFGVEVVSSATRDWVYDGDLSGISLIDGIHLFAKHCTGKRYVLDPSGRLFRPVMTED